MNDKAHSVAHREEHHEHHIPMSRYVAVFVALLVLTGITVFTGKMHLGAAALPLALTIATLKASLVALFFMHLWDAEGASRATLLLSLFFVVLMIVGVLGDVGTRFTAALPDGSVRNPLPGQTAPAADAQPPAAH